MDRYFKQKDNFRCGPVALHNALVWCGYEKSSKESIPKLEKLCKCTKRHGTTIRNFTKTARSILPNKVLYRRNPSIKDIEKYLSKGHALLCNFYYEQDMEIFGHFALIIEGDEFGEFFSVVNGSMGRPVVEYMSRKRLISLNGFRRVDSAIWVVKY